MDAISGFSPFNSPYSNRDPLGAGLTLGMAQARLGLPGLDPVAASQMIQQQNLQLLLLLMGLMQGQSCQANAASNGGAAASGSSSPQPVGGSSTASSGSTSPVAGSSAAGSNSTQPIAGASGDLKADSRGKVKPEQLRAYLEQRIGSSKLNGFKPKDGSRYGVDGSAQSWAAFMTKLVEKESGFNSKDVSEPHAFRGGSRGLFQLSFDDAQNYGLNGGKPFSAEQLADPKLNADAAVTIMERLVVKSGSISGGAGKYWGPVKRGWTGH